MPRRRKRLPPGEWVSTGVAAQTLGVHPNHLLRLRPEMQSGVHWVNISSHAAIRPTYKWNVFNINQWMVK